jgi:hypothetical protein
MTLAPRDIFSEKLSYVGGHILDLMDVECGQVFPKDWKLVRIVKAAKYGLAGV